MNLESFRPFRCGVIVLALAGLLAGCASLPQPGVADAPSARAASRLLPGPSRVACPELRVVRHARSEESRSRPVVELPMRSGVDIVSSAATCSDMSAETFVQVAVIGRAPGQRTGHVVLTVTAYDALDRAMASTSTRIRVNRRGAFEHVIDPLSLPRSLTGHRRWLVTVTAESDPTVRGSRRR